jgi:hypothetical protein
MGDVINFRIRKDDILLLVGILEHSILQGENALRDHESGAVPEWTYTDRPDETRATLATLRRYVEQLKEGSDAPF